MNIDSAEVKIEQRPAVIGMPMGVYVEYFGELPDGTRFVICRPRDDWDYDSFSCFMGTAEKMELVAVRKVVRYRDGGTTDVTTSRGDFHFPPSFCRNGEVSTFNGEIIKVYDRGHEN